MNNSMNRSWPCDPGPSLVQHHRDPWLGWLRRCLSRAAEFSAHCAWCPKGWRASLHSPSPQAGSHASSRNQRRCGRARARLHLCATLPVAPTPALSLEAAVSDSLRVTRWVRCPAMARNLVQVRTVTRFYINRKLTFC